MEGEAFSRCNEGGDARLLLVCDHASNRVPPALGSLGLPPDAFARHIAYDIGAAALTRALSALFDAPAILANFSRLVIDANRGEDDPTLIMALSDGAVIPGNHPLSAAERASRLERYYRPYHGAIAAALDSALARAIAPALISLHSFTPVWRGQRRPWHCGVLWNGDGRIARPLLAALRAEGDLAVGDNEPYSGALEGDCMDRHGLKRGLAHVLIEVRQDLISNEAGVKEWARRLHKALSGIGIGS